MGFQQATRKKLKARIAFCGPPKAGKSFTSLRMAVPLSKADGGKGRIAVIDTEHRSASKYVGLAPDGEPFAFDVSELQNFSPDSFTAEILAAGKAGYDVLIIDSLSHAWMGEGGALSLVDRLAGNKSKFTDGWRDVTPMHNRMIDAIIRSPCHVIVTMRSKMEYVLEMNDKGKQVPVKIGMGPVQRQGMEYEFDIVGDLDQNHVLKIGETRCAAIDGMVTIKPGADFMVPVIEWLTDGTDVPEGYYTANEHDLEKLQQLQAKGAALANGSSSAVPAKSAMQIMQEQVEKGKKAVNDNPEGPRVAVEEPQTAATTTTKIMATEPTNPKPSDYTHKMNGPITATQKQQITTLLNDLHKLDKSISDFAADQCRRLGQPNGKATSMTEEQAAALIQALYSRSSELDLAARIDTANGHAPQAVESAAAAQ